MKSHLSESEGAVIRSTAMPNCCLCSAVGVALYEGLSDRLFGAPGIWSLKRCINENCGLLWLDPMPLPADLAIAYRKYYTHDTSNGMRERLRSAYLRAKYGALGRASLKDYAILLLFHLLPHRRQILDFPAFVVGNQRKGRILEIGCGSGKFLEMVGTLGWLAEGIDFDPKAVKVARSKGLKVYVGDVRDMNLPVGSYDLIFSSHVIEHVVDPVGLMKECHRLLKPSGKVITATPNAGSRLHTQFAAAWRELDPPRHLHVFSGGNLLKLAELAGFTERQVIYANRAYGGILVGSRDLAGTGRHEIAQQRRLTELIEVEARWFGVYWLSKISPALSEEMILVAERG